MIYLTAFVVSFCYIFLKAYQQLNVVGKHYGWVLPISMGMALCEVTVISSVVKDSLWIFLPIGLGGGLGCMLAMWKDTRRSVKNDRNK